MEPDAIAAKQVAALQHHHERMYGWALRLVLAYLDEDAAAAQAIVAQIGRYYDQPGRLPLKTLRYRFARDRLLGLLDVWLEASQGRRPRLPNHERFGTEVIELVMRMTPAESHPDAAVLVDALVEEIPERRVYAHLGGVEANPVVLHVTAAAVAWLVPSLFHNPRSVRTTLLELAKKADHEAMGAPAEEVIEISDAEAITLLGEAIELPEAALPPRDPDRRTLLELELVAIAKRHLLQHPTPQHDELRRLCNEVTLAMAGHSPRTHKPQQPTIRRTQPKRTSRRKRRGS